MTFSLRATQLSRDLDNLLSKLDAPIARIAKELEYPEMTNRDAVNRDTSFITDTLYSLKTLRADVAQGPDAEARSGLEMGLPNTTWPGFMVRFNHIQMVLAQWSGVVSGVNLQLRSKGQDLYPQVHLAERVEAVTEAITDRIFGDLHGFINPNEQSERARSSGGFADIALAHSTFLRHMFAAHRVTLAQRLGRPARFLDVGCGGGMKVLSAARFFCPAEGFDFEPAYVAAAQHMLGLTQPDITRAFEADGLTFDGYENYDVIYFYRPLSDNDKLMQLEEHIVANARPDALLIAPYESFDLRFQELGCARLSGRVYLAQSTQEAADALRIKAECTGLLGQQRRDPASGMWSAIENVLRANGFQ